MTDPTRELIVNLERMKPLTQPLLRSAMRALRLPLGSHGIDVGCGIGLNTLQLAQEIQPGGTVTGVDISTSVLEYARKRTSPFPIADRVLFQQGDMNRLPFEEDTFDWAWSVDCVGYPAGDLLTPLKEMARVVRPRGLVALLAWSSQQILPGFTMLEARLNASCSAYAPYLEGLPPTSHFHRALHWFAEAGIIKPRLSIISGPIQGPLEPDVKMAVTSLFEMLWGDATRVTPEKYAAEYRRLCSPDSPDFILDVPGYCGFFTYTMFKGVVDDKRKGSRLERGHAPNRFLRLN